MKSPIAAVLLFALSAPALAQGEKPPPPEDVLILDNGDRITGEVLSAEKGKITVKTPYAGKISVDMKKVRNITSNHPLLLQLQDGEEIKGTIRFMEDGVLKVRSGVEGDGATIHWDRIRAINPEGAHFKGTLALGASDSGGNVDRLAVSLAADAERRSEVDRLAFRFLWNYAEEEGIRTARNTYAGLKYDYFFTKGLYGLISAELFSDEFKDLDLRVVAGAGLGYQIIEEKTVHLFGEAGVTYISENLDVGEDDSYVAGRLAAKFSWTISGAVTFTEHVTYYPSLEENLFTARNEASVTNAIGGGWSLKITNILEYDSAPSPGFERLDSLWLLSLQYTFG